MSSSDADFNDEASYESSADDESRASLRATSSPPISPRKRRRSASVGSPRGRKSHLNARYNDAYRVLYNETVSEAAKRFVEDESLQPDADQIGASFWSAKEKSIFFAALERLGKNDPAGIAKAIGSKSIPETQKFLLLLQDAPAQRDVKRDRNLEVTLQDIPAALEIGVDCEDALELAGDALAWYQERFEAKQEQERYGRYWLISPEVADDIEDAVDASTALESTPPSPLDGEEDHEPHGSNDAMVPQILQEIPEATLLKPTALLHLSKHVFMNPTSTVSYPWPHWMDLVSELAGEPSIYRTALIDFHTLVVSLTRRIVQCAIIQATSRIRSQDWRITKGVKPIVKRRDVLTTVDLLGLRRNSGEQWRSVARRCGLRIVTGTKRGWDVRGSKGLREVPWDEVEHVLGNVDTPADVLSTDAETAGLTSGIEDENFRSKAMRSGSPLLTGRSALLSASEEDRELHEMHQSQDEDSDSDAYQSEDERASQTTTSVISEDANATYHASEDELNATEDFDATAGRLEEHRICGLLGMAPARQESPKLKEDTEEPKVKALHRKPMRETNDWRNWTDYRAEWETFRTPVPRSAFIANQKRERSSEITQSVEQEGEGVDSEAGSSSEDGSGRRRVPAHAELPIRGARAYAAMRDLDDQVDDDDDDDAMDWE